MTTKIPVTKQQLLEIANDEFAKDANYKPHLKITDARYLGDSLLLEISIINDEDVAPILESQEFANRISNKYKLID
ncbi:hypothetical protein H8K38_14755 [Undibacterium sp. FT79W]|uniref:hypothetical protein n=1 Tax=Undibacterium sp. FT79W TaxID=2762296 RepID=UPI00164B27CD|nr:hypothetical protein [Undibacterium sp. FT79W]MBC3879071.1 hypothetical protein [Undibacterium sp. FT79W]